MDAPPSAMQSSTETTPLVIDRTKLRLTAADEDHLAGIAEWLELKEAEAAVKIAEEKKGPFRFLDLPAELRNRVYSHVFANEGIESQNLSNFKLPPITRASKQLRSESLPAFFSDNLFHVVALSNFEHRRWYRIYQTSRYANHNKDSGVLGVRQMVKKIIRVAGPNALFRDFIFTIVSTTRYGANVNRDTPADKLERRVASFVHLQWKQGNLGVEIVNGLAYPPELDSNTARYFICERQDVDAATEAVKSKAIDIAGRQDFKGFKLTDLEKIVKVLRFVIPMNE